MPAPQPSVLCKLYYNSGTNASPTWVEIAQAKDVTWNGSTDGVDTSSRRSPQKFQELTQEDFGELTFGYLYVDGGGDTVYEALLAAAVARPKTKMQFAMVDKAIATSGACGKKCYMQLKMPEIGEALNGVREINWTAVPTFYMESSAVVEGTHFEVT